MTLISQESLLEKLQNCPADQFYNIASIRNFIKAEEEAVTRCGKCEWLKDGLCTNFAAVKPFLSDFCSKGEKRRS